MKSMRFATVFILAGTFLIAACNNEPVKTGEPETVTTDTAAKTAESSPAFDHLLVDNKKDPSCGMPVTAGISDTAHYKDKVLGFCSKECKESFHQNPEANLAAAELK